MALEEGAVRGELAPVADAARQKLEQLFQQPDKA